MDAMERAVIVNNSHGPTDGGTTSRDDEKTTCALVGACDDPTGGERHPAEAKDAGPPPDGGLKAWMSVFAVHLVVMNTWGFINSYGVFQAYYATSLGRPPSDISWIGSMQVFLLYFVGAFTGRLTDAGYFRALFVAGTVFQAVGIFAAAQFGDSYWKLFLFQGVGMGLGNGCLLCPSIAVLTTYFSRHRNFAMGAAAAGSATGGLVYPVMARQLLAGTAGFPWAMRAMGFVQLATLVLAGLLIHPRMPPRRTGPWVDLAAFRELGYSFYTAGSFFIFLGVYFGFYYVASYSRDVVGLSYSDSLNLLLVLNTAGLCGRLVLGSIADRVGPITAIVPMGLSAGVCVMCWPNVRSTAGMVAWAVAYGFVGGAIQSLFTACAASLTTDLRRAGVRMGTIFTTTSFAALTGTPIAGAIMTASGGYAAAQIWAGAVLLFGTAFVVSARLACARRASPGHVWAWRAKV